MVGEGEETETPFRKLSPKGVDKRQCASKDAGLERGGFGGAPTSMEERNDCQRGCWAPKGVDCEIPNRLERRTEHPYKGCGNLFLAVLKTLRRSPEGKTQRGEFAWAIIESSLKALGSNVYAVLVC